MNKKLLWIQLKYFSDYNDLQKMASDTYASFSKNMGQYNSYIPSNMYFQNYMLGTFGGNAGQQSQQQSKVRISKKSVHSSNDLPQRPPPSQSKNLRQSIPMLMKEMENVLDSRQTKNLSKSKKSVKPESQNLYPQQVSIIKSDISVPKEDKQKQIHLPQLEMSLVSQILRLREQKIILMQKFNGIYDVKNQLDREIKKINRKKAFYAQGLAQDHIIERDLNNTNNENYNLKWAPNTTYYPVIQKYEQIKQSLMEIQNEKIEDITQAKSDFKYVGIRIQYQKLTKMCESLQETLYAMQQAQQKQNESSQVKALQKLYDQVSNLEKYKQKLQKNENLAINQEITRLNRQNEELVYETRRILEKKRRMGEVTTLAGLNKVIQMEENLKEFLIQEMQKLKNSYQKAKKQNSDLLKQLNESK